MYYMVLERDKNQKPGEISFGWALQPFTTSWLVETLQCPIVQVAHGRKPGSTYLGRHGTPSRRDVSGRMFIGR